MNEVWRPAGRHGKLDHHQDLSEGSVVLVNEVTVTPRALLQFVEISGDLTNGSLPLILARRALREGFAMHLLLF